jgi:hypothetical protein
VAESNIRLLIEIQERIEEARETVDRNMRYSLSQGHDPDEVGQTDVKRKALVYLEAARREVAGLQERIAVDERGKPTS